MNETSTNLRRVPSATELAELRELQKIVQESAAIVFRWDAAPGWPIRYVSDNIRRWGLDPGELTSRARPYEELIAPEDRAQVEEAMTRFVASGATEYAIEYRVRPPDGLVRWVEEDGRILRDERGQLLGFQGIVLDVSTRHEIEARLARQRAELEWQMAERAEEIRAANERLEAEVKRRQTYEARWRETAARYQAIVEAYDGLIYICSVDKRIEFMNSRMISRTGHDATGEMCYQALHDLDTPCPWCVNDRVFQGETVRWEVKSPKDGRWYYIVNSLIRHSDGRLSKMAMIQDVTERKEAELALQESERRYRRLLESVTDYVYTVEIREGRPVSTHHGPGCEAITGYRPEEYAANPFLWLNMVYAEDRPAVLAHAEAVLKGAETRSLEHRIVRKDGAIRWVRNTPSPHRDAQGTLIGYDGLVKDITEQRLAQEERLRLERETAEARQREALERANRLASLGLLAAGVAHEVNNPLQGMLSHLAAVERDLPPDFPRRQSLAMVERGIETIRGLVQRLLWLGSGHDESPSATCFSEAAAFVRELLHAPLRKTGIRLEIELRTPDVRLPISHSELVQILINLVTNARDAMPAGGRIVIACERRENRAVLIVSDTGMGIPPHIQPRLFTPFFTTKGARGAGLGLSIVHSIVRAHGGEISFQSEAGRGTTFSIEFPLLEAQS